MKKTMLLIGCIGVSVTTNATAMFGRFSSLKNVSKVPRSTIQQRKCSEKETIAGWVDVLYNTFNIYNIAKIMGSFKDEISTETVYKNISMIERLKKAEDLLAQETRELESNKLELMKAYVEGKINLNDATKLVTKYNDSCNENRNACQKIRFVNEELEKENQEWRDKWNKNQNNQK